MDFFRTLINNLIYGFCNFWVSVILLLIYGSACGVATFIENDYGSASARALIYDTQAFDLLHLLLVLNLIGLLVLSRAWQRKKYASLLFHSALVVIFVGAAITRYYGFEGTMHIREGEMSQSIQSQNEFLTIFAKIDEQMYRAFFPVNITPVVQQSFKREIPFINLQNHKDNFTIKFLAYKPSESVMQSDIMEVEVSYKGESRNIEVVKNITGELPLPFDLGDAQFALDWGNKEILLPFSLKLKKFELDRYAGSMSPSSYASEIEVIDEKNGVVFPYRIFMNNVLDYGGYRFFQSSYDQDEKGTILSVNNDPGKIPTYIGYAMLTIGLLWAFFAKNGRFHRLSLYLKAQNLCLAFALVMAFGATNTYANDLTQEQTHRQEINSQEIDSQEINPLETNSQEINLQEANTQSQDENLDENLIPPITNESILNLLENLKTKSQKHSQAFGTLIVQDFGGRMKPLDTLAMEYIHKITKKDNFLGLSNMQLFLGMLAYPNEFKKIKMIAISHPQLKTILGVDKNEKYIAFDDAFFEGQYMLANLLEEANRKKPSMRDKFDKEIIHIDECINLIYLVYTAQSLRIIPDFKGGKTWFSLTDAFANFDPKDSEQLQKLFQTYFVSFDFALANNQWENANKALEAIKAIQAKMGAELIPSKSKVDLEIFLNHYNLFSNLTLFYILAGILLFGIVLIQVFRGGKSDILASKILHGFIGLLVAIHTMGLGIRWYVGEHAPWSNAYESMIYVAWAAGIAGVVFFRKSYLALATASFLAGICLFVAHLGFMDPQIGNLVPVLKSYWLNIHVSIITASYGFLGLCFMLGAITLLLFILRSPKRQQIDKTILTLHTINEMAMILGLAMLTIGNFLGGVWANESWGRYWGWDPKETWALISIMVYVIVLHIRFIPKGDNPYVFASLNVIGFYSILMTYFGVNYYLSGMHSYAAGDPLPIPVFLYYFVAGTILLILLASRKSDLASPKLP